MINLKETFSVLSSSINPVEVYSSSKTLGTNLNDKKIGDKFVIEIKFKLKSKPTEDQHVFFNLRRDDSKTEIPADRRESKMFPIIKAGNKYYYGNRLLHFEIKRDTQNLHVRFQIPDNYDDKLQTTNNDIMWGKQYQKTGETTFSPKEGIVNLVINKEYTIKFKYNIDSNMEMEFYDESGITDRKIKTPIREADIIQRIHNDENLNIFINKEKSIVEITSIKYGDLLTGAGNTGTTGPEVNDSESYLALLDNLKTAIETNSTADISTHETEIQDKLKAIYNNIEIRQSQLKDKEDTINLDSIINNDEEKKYLEKGEDVLQQKLTFLKKYENIKSTELSDKRTFTILIIVNVFVLLLLVYGCYMMLTNKKFDLSFLKIKKSSKNSSNNNNSNSLNGL